MFLHRAKILSTQYKLCVVFRFQPPKENSLYLLLLSEIIDFCWNQWLLLEIDGCFKISTSSVKYNRFLQEINTLFYKIIFSTMNLSNNYSLDLITSVKYDFLRNQHILTTVILFKENQWFLYIIQSSLKQ